MTFVSDVYKRQIMELPHLVSYQFNHYRSVPVVNGMEEAAVVTSAAGMERLAREAAHVAESTMLARDLVNHPSMFMDPEQLAKAVSYTHLNIWFRSRSMWQTRQIWMNPSSLASGPSSGSF